MKYLINFAIEGDPKISCACKCQDDVSDVMQIFDDSGITLHQVCWLSYFLQRHGMNRLATLVAVSL